MHPPCSEIVSIFRPRTRYCIQGKLVSRFIASLALSLRECLGTRVRILASRDMYVAYARLEENLHGIIVEPCSTQAKSSGEEVVIVLGCRNSAAAGRIVIEAERKCSKSSRKLRVEKKNYVYLLKSSGRVLGRFLINNSLLLEKHVPSRLEKKVLDYIKEYLENYGPVKASFMRKQLIQGLGLDRALTEKVLRTLVELEYIGVDSGYIVWVYES